jgi:hypothetical protein
MGQFDIYQPHCIQQEQKSPPLQSQVSFVGSLIRSSIADCAILGRMTKPAPKKRLPRPRDPMQLAKLIGDIATRLVEDRQTETLPAPSAEDIRRVMSVLGKVGGKKGGKARAENLSSRRRKEIAKKAAQARWKKKPR